MCIARMFQSWIITCVLNCLLQMSFGQESKDCVIDLVMVVDVSGSIKDTDIKGEVPNWDRVVAFMENVVQGLNVGTNGTRIGVVTFGNKGILEFNLHDHDRKLEYREAVKAVDYKGGNTNTTGGLRVARQQIFELINGGNRADVADVILLITDGKPTREADKLLEEVQTIKDMNIRIIGIGVTSQVNTSLLLEVVSNKNTDYFPVGAFDELAQILDRIIQQTCRVVTTSTVVPTTTTTTTTPGDCTNTADVYFLLDGSGSINENNFVKMKQFISQLLQEFTIDNGRIRVGLAVFSTVVRNEFTLTTHTTLQSMKEAVLNIKYPRGTTNTAAAIRFVRETGFGGGQRDQVPNILVILTDGNSNQKKETLNEAHQAKTDGIHIITIGIGDWTNKYELKSVASHPYNWNYLAVETFSDLNEALKMTLRDLICDNQNECISNPCRNQGICINMIHSYMCNCPNGVAGVNCERTCQAGNDFIFALDSSGSIGEDNFFEEIDFVRNLIYGINMNDARVGVVQFSNNSNIQFQLNTFGSSKMGIINGLSMYYMGGTTNTAGALSEMRNKMFNQNNGDSKQRENIGVILTDGRSNSFRQTWDQARQIRAGDVKLVVVGIGNNLVDAELQAIASFPNDKNVIKAVDFRSLSNIRNDLLDAICNNNNECASSPCLNEGECHDLINGYECVCKAGYSGQRCERGCDGLYDIVFVIDTSGSIGNRRFPDVLELVVSITEKFEVGENKARFGAMLFSDNVEILFHLNKFAHKQDVITGIRTGLYRAGRTNIASALETAKNQMFTAENGDRLDVSNYIILLTDGASNIRTGEAVKTAVDMRVDGTKITVIGIGNDANTLELRGMSSDPLKRMMMMAESFNSIKANNQLREQIVDSIVSSTCNDVNECNSNPCRNGGQCIDDLHMFWCECNSDFTGQTCNRECTNQMDVTFVLDFSGSLNDVFNIVIAFAKEVVYGLPVRFNRAKVAAITFSDDAVMNFNLNTYTSKREIINALSFSLSGGRTNTQSALSMMNNDVFTSGQGDRSGVKNIAIVVSDGGSNVQREQTILRAQDAQNRGVDIYVAAFGKVPDMSEINGIASDPDSSYIVRIENAGLVEKAASDLLDRLCQ